jgi:hypothetical protein
MKTNLLLLSGIIMLFSSCGDYGYNSVSSLGGSQSDIGIVGNTFTLSTVAGLSGLRADITALTDGISRVEYSTVITDDKLLDMVDHLSEAEVNGNQVTRSREYRITSEGIESVYPEGNLILVKYDAKVGDEYSLKRGSKTVRRKVTEVNKEDNYYWNGFFIKTIKVEETGRGIPGVSKVEYYANHRFGIVGITVLFEDGSSQSINIVSYYNN